MSMKCSPAVRKRALDVVPLPNLVKHEVVDLESVPHNQCVLPIDLDDDDSDDYIPDIPGVKRLGIKRRPCANYTAPSKLQAISPWNADLLPVAKKLVFSTDKPLTALPKYDGQAAVEAGKTMPSSSPNRSNAVGVKGDGKPLLTSLVKGRGNDVGVTDRVNTKGDMNEPDAKLDKFKILQDEVSSLKSQFSNAVDDSKKALVEKDTLIMKLQKEIGGLKESLQKLTKDKETWTFKHDGEIQALIDTLQDVRTEKDNLLTRHGRETDSLRDSVRDLNREHEKSVMKHNREVDSLKTSFSIEKALLEDRHRQQMTAYRTEILNVVLHQGTQQQEAQSSVLQVTGEGTSVDIAK